MTPSAYEQEMLELINRARANPLGEFDALIADASTQTGVTSRITDALRYFDVDLDLFRTQLATYDPVAPLAWNSALAQVADTHSQDVIDQDRQFHASWSVTDARLDAAGYDNLTSFRENVFAWGEDALYSHAGFYIDWGFGVGGMQDPAGHRDNILSASVTEVGMGVIADTSSATSVGPYVVTQDFGNRSDYLPQLVGVALRDADGDAFYDAGEGLGGVVVTVVDSGGAQLSTQTWVAGGYQIALDPGAYTVYFTGGTLDGAIVKEFVMGTENVKVDAHASEAALIGTVLADNLSLGAGSDSLAALDGHDTVSGNGGNDTLDGGAGNDRLFGGIGFDVLQGGVWNDYLDGGDHADNLDGGWGHDTLIGGNGFDVLEGNSGNDMLYGDASPDRLSGGDGDDFLSGGTNYGSSRDGLNGGAGNDTLMGDAGFDVLDGGTGDDSLDGGAQADNLYGGDGNDTLLGGAGFDRLFSGTGNNLLDGGSGTDALFGMAGQDTLLGGSENDRLWGGAGFDRLEGGAGNDTLIGGFNADTFVFADGHGQDVIADFSAGGGFERIDVTGQSALTSFVDIMHNHASQTASGVLIDGTNGQSILLQGLSLSDLVPGDFIF